MLDEQIADIVSSLERSLPEEKRDVVYVFMERLCLYARAIARAAQSLDAQLTQMQGAIEIFQRCFDQRRDYSYGPGHGRPDAVFVEMLLQMGQSYNILEDVQEALLFTAARIKTEGLVN